MNEPEAQSVRFSGTVAVWFSSHYQIEPRDWNNIKEFNGPNHPLFGYYRSDDRDVLRQQLHDMRRAGIDAIVYDVFSTGKWGLTDLPHDATLPLLVELLASQKHESRKLQLIIWLEKYLGNPTLEEYRYALEYVGAHLAGHDFYYCYDGKPLLVTYLNGQSDAIDQIDYANDHFAMRRIRPYYSDVWSYIDHWPQRLNREWMVASPGFDAFLENAYIAKYVRQERDPDYEKIRQESRRHSADREDGAYFKKQLLRARTGNPKIIFISGWNDWQYGNQIEPAVEYEYKYVDLAAQLLGRQEETAPYRQTR